MTMTIDAVYLDTRTTGVISGSTWTLQDSARIKEADSGVIEANPRWPRRRMKGTLSWVRGADTVENLYEVNGQSIGFLYISAIDRYRVATDQAIGTGNAAATTFQLKLTRSTSARSVPRTIKYPLTGTVTIKFDGANQASGWSVSTTTGVVTFDSAPGSGVVITASFQWAWPVHFISEAIDVTLIDTERKELRSAMVEEIFV